MNAFLLSVLLGTITGWLITATLNAAFGFGFRLSPINFWLCPLGAVIGALLAQRLTRRNR